MCRSLLKSQNRVSETNSSLRPLSSPFLRGKGNRKEINFDPWTQNLDGRQCFHDPARFLPLAQPPLFPSLGLQRPFKPSSSPGKFIQGAWLRGRGGRRGGGEGGGISPGPTPSYNP